MTLEYRMMERVGLRVSSLAFGSWGISGAFGAAPEASEYARVLDAAWDAGINLFDTAPVYGAGLAEEMLGRMPWRNNAVIATKLSVQPKPSPPIGRIEQYYSRDAILAGLHGSLKRLQRDWVDVLQLHAWFPEWEADPFPTFEVLDDLKRQGNIRAIGVSLPSVRRDTIAGLLKWNIVDALQVPLSLLQFWARPLVAEAARHQVAVLNRTSLCFGALAGNPERLEALPESDVRKTKFDGRIVRRLHAWQDAACRTVGIDASRLPYYAIEFVRGLPGITSVVVGMRTTDQVIRNANPSNYAFSAEQRTLGASCCVDDIFSPE